METILSCYKRRLRRVASPLRRRVMLSPWGIDWHTDGLRDFFSVTSWDISSEEYLRVFPRLIPSGSGVPANIAEHLRQCVAVLAYRRNVWGHGHGLETLDMETAHQLAVTHMHEWFVDDGGCEPPMADSILKSDEGLEAIISLDRLLENCQRDCPPKFAEDLAARVAFWSGIHPVYFWPEALLSHELFTTIGLLGYVRRGRGAMLPRDIAQYLCESIVADGCGECRAEGAELAHYIGSPDVANALLNAAIRRLRGVSFVCLSIGSTIPRRSHAGTELSGTYA